MIEARPKSGYYVKYLPARFAGQPQAKSLLKKPEKASVAQMIAMVSQNMTEDNVLRLSRSAPPLNLIPLCKAQ